MTASYPGFPFDDEPGPIPRLAPEQGPAGRAGLGRHHQGLQAQDIPHRSAQRHRRRRDHKESEGRRPQAHRRQLQQHQEHLGREVREPVRGARGQHAPGDALAVERRPERLHRQPAGAGAGEEQHPQGGQRGDELHLAQRGRAPGQGAAEDEERGGVQGRQPGRGRHGGTAEALTGSVSAVASVGQQNRNGNHAVSREKSYPVEAGSAFRIQRCSPSHRDALATKYRHK